MGDFLFRPFMPVTSTRVRLGLGLGSAVRGDDDDLIPEDFPDDHDRLIFAVGEFK